MDKKKTARRLKCFAQIDHLTIQRAKLSVRGRSYGRVSARQPAAVLETNTYDQKAVHKIPVDEPDLTKMRYSGS